MMMVTTGGIAVEMGATKMALPYLNEYTINNAPNALRICTHAARKAPSIPQLIGAEKSVNKRANGTKARAPTVM